MKESERKVKLNDNKTEKSSDLEAKKKKQSTRNLFRGGTFRAIPGLFVRLVAPQEKHTSPGI